MGWLDGQVALVTGGGSGTGRAVVARFVEESARVGIMERVATRADRLRREFGDKVAVIAGNVARLADNKRAVAEAVRAFGHLDIFVANAGVFDVDARLAEFDEDELGQAYDELFGVNVKDVIFGAKAAFPERAKTRGSMVVTASVAGQNSGGGARYAASRHAVVGLIRELAVDLGPDVRVNGVAVGGTMTDLHGLVSLGNDNHSQSVDPAIAEPLRAGNLFHIALKPADLAAAYVLLALRRDPRGITGAIVVVDAGAMLYLPRPC